MRRFFKLVLCFILMISVSSFSFAKPKKGKKKVRSASSASGLVSVKSKSKSLDSSSSSSKKSKKSSKKSKSSKDDDDNGKKGKKDKNKENSSENGDNSTSSEPEVSETEKCMIENLDTLLDGDCKFLNEEHILSKLTNKFYCIYNVKDKTKTESVYNYNLYQNYGVRESVLKDNDASVTIKNPSNGSLKGSAKYYDFLLKGLANNSLSDGRILDFITEEIIEENDTLFAGQEATVQNVSVSSTSIAMDYSKSDIENCRKATKKAIQTCGITGNVEMQSKIDSSCNEYNSALMKNAAEKKSKVLDAKVDLAKILLNRAGAVIDAKNYKASLDEKDIDLKKKENDIKNKKDELEKSESDAADKKASEAEEAGKKAETAKK